MDTRHETRIGRCTLLKRDALGTILLINDVSGPRVMRDTSAVAASTAWLSRRLARREHAALLRAAGIPGVPVAHTFDGTRLVRSFLPGTAMHLGRFEARPYFKDALRVLRRMHQRGIVHNDLAKEANWICMPGQRAGIVDFQLAAISRRRSRLFRVLAREDLRHLLKHKHHYAPESLTPRQRRLLQRPSGLASLWRFAFKPMYWLVTRKLLGWRDRPDARERETRVIDFD